MDPTFPKNEKQHDTEGSIESLPNQVRQWCLAGKSISETAHLVKNIIQMVSGSAEIIKIGMEKKQLDRVRRSWEIFEPNLKRLNKFVLDLIKYTRHYPIQKTPCDFNQLIRHVFDRNVSVLKKHSVTLRLTEDKTIEPMALDPECIQEMMENLITHAMENLCQKSGTIQISTKNLPDHKQVQVSVLDDAPALTEETIRSLRQPSEREKNMFGTGFDIPLARIYIEQHDGYMEFESTPPKGNSVHVYLPLG